MINWLKKNPNLSRQFSSVILNKQIIAAMTEQSCLSGPQPCPQLSPRKLLGYLRSVWVRFPLITEETEYFRHIVTYDFCPYQYIEKEFLLWVK